MSNKANKRRPPNPYSLTAGFIACCLIATLVPVARMQAADAPQGVILPVPPEADQSEADKIIKELFAADLAKHTPQDAAAAAQHLAREADKRSSDPTARFVLLKKSRDLAIAAGDPGQAWQAIDKLASAYAVDRDAMQLAALAGLVKMTLVPTAAGQAATYALGLADHLCDASDYAAADRVATEAETFALRSRNPKLLTSVRARGSEIRAQLLEYDRARAALEKLKQNPDDPEANLATGTFLSFTKGDWSKGLPYLAKGSDPLLKHAALAEVGVPSTDPRAKAIGDEWWDSADKKTGPSKAAMRRRAAEWYRNALPNLAGLTQELVRKRIGEAGESPSHVVNLLALIDPQRDGVNGSWRMEGDTLVSHAGTLVRLAVPYLPPAEYDIRIVYHFTTGNEGMMIMLPVSGGNFMTVVNPGSFYFEDVGGSFSKANRAPVVRGQPCAVTVRVRKNHVQALIDGQLISEFNPAERRLGLKDGWHVRDDKCIGLGNWDTTIVFTQVELTEVSGTGTRKQ